MGHVSKLIEVGVEYGEEPTSCLYGYSLCASAAPFREWTENSQLWVQQVASTPCTRMDVVHLQEQLDLKLQQRQARETGICPVRRELYTQCFGKSKDDFW